MGKDGGGLSLNAATHAAANEFTVKKKLSEKSQPPRPTKTKLSGSTPDTKGKLLTLKQLGAFLASRPIADSELPNEISKTRFEEVLRDVIKDKQSRGEGATTSGVLGDCWEKLAIEYPQVRSYMETVLREGSLYLLDAFLRTHLTENGDGFEGFLNAQGNFVRLDAIAGGNLASARDKRLALRKDLIGQVSRARAAKNLDEMGSAGIVYADSLTIGKKKFKDGLYVMSIGEYRLWLTDTEFKTAGSKGLGPQSATALVRLAGADANTTISMRIGGKSVDVPLGKILFNPLDFDSHVGVKAGNVDYDAFTDLASLATTQALKERLAAQKRQRAQIPSVARTNFGEDLKTLATNLYKLGVDTNLRGMRKVIFDLLASAK